MTVTLTWFELFEAAIVGAMRQIEALKGARRDDLHGRPTEIEAWARHIEGAAAELAAAKMLGQYWNALGPKPKDIASDVGANVQVRSTGRANGSLILHPDDPDDAHFYLLVGTAPTYTALGPVRAGNVKRPEFWRTDTGRPAFFVPQSEVCW